MEDGIVHRTLSVLYGAAAAVCRGDQTALALLAKEDLPRRAVWEAAIVTVAQAAQNSDVSVVDVLDAVTLDPVGKLLLEGAAAWQEKDRSTVRFCVIEMDRSGSEPVSTSATLLAELWALDASAKGMSLGEYSQRLCLAVNLVNTRR